MYKYNSQERLETFAYHKDPLKKNSEKRIETNKNYQSFLSQIEKKNFDSEQVELFNQSDVQHLETLNIMKDYIFLKTIEEKAS